MQDEKIIEYLDSLSEDGMIELVILPLYKKRFVNKLYKIEFTGKDKREDAGIDITYYEIRPDTKTKEYGGVQVKQHDINNGKSANGIASLQIQAAQAFAKPIVDVQEKREYRIHGYTVLTTGEILPKARATMVDLVHQPIRFVDGKTLCSWINESFEAEIESQMREAGKLPDEAEDEDVDDVEPAEAIASYLQETCAEEVEDIQSTLSVLDSHQRNIVLALMTLGTSKTFAIAKHLGRSASYLQTDLDSLLGEEVITIGDGGYSLYASADNLDRLRTIASRRIRDLGYDESVSVTEVLDELF